MLILAGGGFAGLLASRRLGLLTSVHSVERRSSGDLLFPVGIALLFVVGREDPMLYLIGLSYMVVSDALAALVGRRYGMATFAVERQHRSVEGSVTFFVVSFLVAHLILLLGTDAPPVTSVLVATQLAILVTGFEAISLRGHDNLLVPLVTLLIASRLLDLPSAILARDLLVQVVLVLVVAYATWRWRFAGVTGAVMLALFLYGAYAFGGVLWVAAPLLVLAAYVLLHALPFKSRSATPPNSHHQVVAVFYVTVVAAALYLAAEMVEVLAVGGLATGDADLLVAPYLGAAASQLALLIYTFWRPWDASPETLEPGLLPALLAAVVVLPLSAFTSGGIASALLWTGGTPMLALVIYRKVRSGSSWPRAIPWNSRLQAAAVSAALVIATPFHLSLFVG
jgi:hypothetical protein